mmetsp:Transcript_40914/g.66871  ORF Transcript_40914/g.66871 Transcript_40914/m.66871 type:complete len:91 (-) Transcript_40914:144-416(-)
MTPSALSSASLASGPAADTDVRAVLRPGAEELEWLMLEVLGAPLYPLPFPPPLGWPPLAEEAVEQWEVVQEVWGGGLLVDVLEEEEDVTV